MRFLIDMNLSPQWVQALTDAGHDALHWSHVGAATAEDRQIIEYAAANHYVILTQDLDFGILLAVGGLHTPSVIQLRAQAVLPNDISPQVFAAINATQQHLKSGAMVTVTSDKHRVTVLPIDRSDG